MRKEILKLGAGWVLCAAAWAACGGEKTVTLKGRCFEVTVPDNGGGGARRVTWEGNKCGGYVIVYDVKENDGLRSFFAIEEIRYLLTGCTVTDICMVKLDGRNAIKLTVEGGSWKWTYYYTVAGVRGYVIRLYATKDNFGAASKEFDTIVASFKMIEAK